MGMQGGPLGAGVDDGIPLDETLLPQGNGTFGATSWNRCPNRRGFDTFFGYHNGFLGYYDGSHRYSGVSGLDFWRNENKAWYEVHGRYLPEVIAQEAVRVIENHDKWTPLFLLVSAPTPHTGNLQFGLEPPPEQYSNLSDPHRRLYADILRYLDDTLGNVTQALKTTQLIDNTIILFMSDNGAPTVDKVDGFSNYGSNYPFRGTKFSVYEGGVRVPSVLWWSGLNKKGSEMEEMFHVTDWLPTFNSAAGGFKIDGLDGKDQWGFLNDRAPPARDEVLVEINDSDGTEAYISGDFKLLKEFVPSNPRYYTGMFYSTDPSEEQHPYNANEVLKSKVAQSLGSQLNAETITLERERARTSISRCSTSNQADAVMHNCYDNYCLFNITDDPSECKDVYHLNIQVAKKLEFKIRQIKGNMEAKRYHNKILYPEDFYWTPLSYSDEYFDEYLFIM